MGYKINIVVLAVIASLFIVAIVLTSMAFNLLKTTGSIIEIGTAAIIGAFFLITATIFILAAIALLYVMLELCWWG
ncbi:MAG: hypothetical protein QXY75_02990 [Candidatus Bathyarchaeia archaeon]